MVKDETYDIVHLILIFQDGTDYDDPCTTEADSCTYPNALCIPSNGINGTGVCGCEDGLEYNAIVIGCCKC